jgi:ATP phosphoribosyltransferase regulatory subunit
MLSARHALDELEKLSQLLRESGAGLAPLFDLGEVRQFNYYSGMMFKVYHSRVGDDLGGGGRYDRLFDRYGLDVPAVGFGFDLARVTEALPRGENGEAASALVNARDGAIALREALELRAKGQGVTLAEGKR